MPLTATDPRVTTSDFADSIGNDLACDPAPARAKPTAATQKLYWRDFENFGLWCQEHGFTLLPAAPEAVAAYLKAGAASGTKFPTMAQRCAAIRYVHSIGRHPIPTDDERVKAVMRGIRRNHRPRCRRTAAVTPGQIIAMAPPAAGNLTALRDRALLFLSFAGEFRRSELMALDVADVAEVAGGLRVTIGRAKPHAETRGVMIAIAGNEANCPVAALREWLRAAGISQGPLFRPIRRGGHVQSQRLTSRSVTNILKLYAARAGLDVPLSSEVNA